MDQAIAVVLSAAIGGVVAFATANRQIKGVREQWRREEQAEREREREKERIRYLDPLVVAAQDLLSKLQSLQRDLVRRETFWRDAFIRIKERDRSDRVQFAFDCNGFDAGATTALYVTAVYLARAKKIRSELPFVQLGPWDDKALLEKLTAVRKAFGGTYGLWEELQDSIGSYVTQQDGAIMDYKGFCSQLLDPWDHIWFTRLIDFYKDAHMRQEAEIPQVIVALEELIAFASAASMPRRP